MTNTNNVKILKTDNEFEALEVIRKSVSIFRRNLLLIILSVISGTLIGFVIFLTTPATYTSRLIADSNTLPNLEVINIVNSWNALIKKNEYQILADKLHLDIDLMKKVKKMEATDTQILGLDEAETEDKRTFTLTVEVSDMKVLDSLERAVINYLESNEFVKKRIEIKKANLISLKNKINREITDLDSIKTSVKNILKSGGNNSSTFLTDPASVNLQIIALYERVLGIESSLVLLDDIQVIEGFTKFNKPDNPKLSICLIGGFLIGIVIAIVIIAIKIITYKLNEVSF